jgi:hypothetical protein
VAPTSVHGRLIERTSTRSTVDREVVESLKPEVLRSVGYWAWRPEQDEPATTDESVTGT